MTIYKYFVGLDSILLPSKPISIKPGLNLFIVVLPHFIPWCLNSRYYPCIFLLRPIGTSLPFKELL